MAVGLVLKVSASDYEQKMQILSSKMNELETIYGEYNKLKMQANRVIGENDSNTEKLKAAIDANMEAISKQHAALKNAWEMLNQQNQSLGLTTVQLGTLLDTAKETIVAAANTFQALADL